MIRMLAGVSAALLGLAGCGGNGRSSAGLPQKTAIITFSTVSSAHTAPLDGIQLATHLPAGATVADISSALVGTNDTGQVSVKNYLPAPPTVSFIVQPTGVNPIKFGTFALLKCDIASGVTLDQNSFTVAIRDIQMTGKDASGSTVYLENQIPVKLSVTFGY